MKKTLEERFWEKVDKDGPTQPHMTTPCWVWTGALFKKSGYGQFQMNGSPHLAHRVAHYFYKGLPPGALLVLHRCDYRPCVREDHLFLGTHADNGADMAAKGRGAEGNRNGLHLHPERRSFGMRNGHVTRPERTPRGVTNGRAKLSEEEVLAIRGRFRAGETQTALAAEFGLDQTSVSSIVRGETWKHLPL